MHAHKGVDIERKSKRAIVGSNDDNFNKGANKSLRLSSISGISPEVICLSIKFEQKSGPQGLQCLLNSHKKKHKKKITPNLSDNFCKEKLRGLLNFFEQIFVALIFSACFESCSIGDGKEHSPTKTESYQNAAESVYLRI
jgi:hypothetical protein